MRQPGGPRRGDRRDRRRRAALPGSEDHDSLDEAGFARAEAVGSFALAWCAHGLRYGVPRSAALDVAAGRVVVANLSRGVLDEAVAPLGRLRIVEVTARPEVLVARLTARGRRGPARRRELHAAGRFGRPRSHGPALVDHLKSLCGAG